MVALSAAELVTSGRSRSPLRLRLLLLVLITKCDDCRLLVHSLAAFLPHRVHRGFIIHVTHIQTAEVHYLIGLTEVLRRPFLLLDTVRVEAIASSFCHLCGHSHLFPQLLLLPLLIFRILNSYQLVCLLPVTVLLLTLAGGDDGCAAGAIRRTVGIGTDLSGLVSA